MKKKICIMLSFLLLFIMAGCGSEGAGNGAESTLPQTDGQIEQSSDDEQGGSGTENQQSSEVVSGPEQELGRADQEQNDSSARPAICSGVENMERYDTIILGYPIWHGQALRIISTFLESYDFSGKTIVPFCTSHSSGIGPSVDNLHSLCSDSVNWLEGRRFEAGTTKETLEEWFGDLEIK